MAGHAKTWIDAAPSVERCTVIYGCPLTSKTELGSELPQPLEFRPLKRWKMQADANEHITDVLMLVASVINT
jgi:hypothetical protein